MNITKINFTENNTEDKSVLALVDIVIDYDFIVKNIKYKQGVKGNYLLFPKDDFGRDIAYPIRNDYREYIYGCIEEAYKNYKS